jgi:hypothetical protein
VNDVTRKQAALVDQLHLLTKKKKLVWDRNPFSSDLEASLSGLNVVLDSVMHEDSPFEVIHIKDDQGNTLQSFTDGILANEVVGVEGFGSYWNLMVELREMAEAQASKVEDTLDTLLSRLKEIESPSPRRSAFDSDLDDDVPF